MKNFKSGTYINQGYYRSFQPNFINKSWEISDMEVVTLYGLNSFLLELSKLQKMELELLRRSYCYKKKMRRK